MKEIPKGHLAILSVNLIFGLNTPITKSILMQSHIQPLALTFFRFAGATVAFWIASLFVSNKFKPTKKDIGLFFIASLLGIVLNQMFFVVGLNSTSPVDASIIVTLVPILTMLIAAMYLKEPITTKKVLGVLTGCAGAVLLIVSSNATQSQSSTLTGNLMCIISCLAYAFYLTIFRDVIKRNHPIVLMKWLMLFATLVSFSICRKSIVSIDYLALQWNETVKVLYVVLIATFVAYLFIAIGQARLRPTTLSMYNYFQPVVTTTISIALGLDIFGWHKVFAAILVFLGVYIVTQSKSKAQLDAEKLSKHINKTQ
ncbi:MAG: DMT family transporter [Bacteroidales bacterium]|jgi:drug/metabolite transporter (DMT)-like permease|nr:DMT family transporter [Bacteroidales bacterium]